MTLNDLIMTSSNDPNDLIMTPNDLIMTLMTSPPPILN